MNKLGAIILFALFAATLAVFPQISPSFSFEASLELATISSTPRFNVANDVNRLLQSVNSTSDDDTETFEVSSEFDDATYTSKDGQCTSSAFDTLAYFPLTLDVWSRFELGIENPSGTYTIEENGFAYSSEELVIVNDLPVSYTRIILFSSFTSYTTITITKFNNVAPPSSSFNLPANCAQFTCNACQNPSITTSGNPTTSPSSSSTTTSENPTASPSSPSITTSENPTASPSSPSITTSENPTASPSSPSITTSENPTASPSSPSITTSENPTASPSSPSITTSENPTASPSSPSITTSENPTASPSSPSITTSENPTASPSSPRDNLLQLPESFSFEATAVQTSTYGVTQTFTRYNVAVDSTRMLVINDKVFSDGEFSFVLESEDDNITFTNLNGKCETVPFRVDTYNSFSSPTHVWDIFNTAIEEPDGTFTVENNGITHEIVLEDGLPVSFVFIAEVGLDSLELRISITNFGNSPPPLSVFSLPEVCSNYTCSACYSSAAADVVSTLMLILSAILMLFFSTN